MQIQAGCCISVAFLLHFCLKSCRYFVHELANINNDFAFACISVLIRSLNCASKGRLDLTVSRSPHAVPLNRSDFCYLSFGANLQWHYKPFILHFNCSN